MKYTNAFADSPDKNRRFHTGGVIYPVVAARLAACLLPIGLLCFDVEARAQTCLPFSVSLALAQGDTLNIEARAGKAGGCIIETSRRFRDGKRTDLRSYLPHKPFRIEAADLTGDGLPEICVGVAKKTRFDPVKRKRLFVYRIAPLSIRPLWLGTHIGGAMEDFRVIRTEAGPRLLVIIREKSRGRYAVCSWSWSSFGPSFKRYEARELSFAEAKSICNRIATEPQ